MTKAEETLKAKLLVADISYELGLSHIGSCLKMVEVLVEIYRRKRSDDHFVLDAGHTFLGYCALMQVKYHSDARKMYHHHGTHPDRCLECGIEVSTGSLGLGATIGLGMALADPGKKTYIATTDGALSEGSWSEVLNYAKTHNIKNLYVYVLANGYGAYREIDVTGDLVDRIKPYLANLNITILENYRDYLPLHGLDAHYQKLDKEGYEQLKKTLTP